MNQQNELVKLKKLIMKYSPSGKEVSFIGDMMAFHIGKYTNELWERAATELINENKLLVTQTNSVGILFWKVTRNPAP